jgi:hypothetical protein
MTSPLSESSWDQERNVKQCIHLSVQQKNRWTGPISCFSKVGKDPKCITNLNNISRHKRQSGDKHRLHQWQIYIDLYVGFTIDRYGKCSPLRQVLAAQCVTHLPHKWDLLLGQHRHWYVYKGPPIMSYQNNMQLGWSSPWLGLSNAALYQPSCSMDRWQ